MKQQEKIEEMELSVISNEISELEKERIKVTEENHKAEQERSERQAEIVLDLAMESEGFNELSGSVRNAMQIKAFAADKKCRELVDKINSTHFKSQDVTRRINLLCRAFTKQINSVQMEKMRSVLKDELSEYDGNK